MAFNRPTLTEIIDRIETDLESRLTGNIALLRRGILRILVRVFAGAVHVLYGFIEYISRQLFVTTATTTYLNRHGRMWGINRKAASFAVGTIRFTGTNGTLVPSGTRVQDEDGIELETTAAGTIAGGLADIAGIAVESGTAGNLSSGTVVDLIQPIVDIDDTATLQTDFGGGEDEETDDAYRARILARIQDPPAGGTAADFTRWANEVSGVDKAWTFAATPGPGQVTVVYIGSALEVTVESYISDLMPVTADLIVSKATDVSIDFTIKIDPNDSSYQSDITDNIQQVFDDLASPAEEIKISWINDAIQNAGVDDYYIVSVSGAPQDIYGNILFSGTQLGRLGTITFQDF